MYLNLLSIINYRPPCFFWIMWGTKFDCPDNNATLPHEAGSSVTIKKSVKSITSKVIIVASDHIICPQFKVHNVYLF